MHYVVPNMVLITQDKANVLLVRKRADADPMAGADIPHDGDGPSRSLAGQAWSQLYDKDPGIQNSQIPDFARDLGLKMVPPCLPTPEALLKWLQDYGPLWVNGQLHITVIAAFAIPNKELEVLVFDPDPAYATTKARGVAQLARLVCFGPHRGRDTSAEVQTVFLYVP